MERSVALRRVVPALGALAGFGAAVLGYASVIERRWLDVTHHTVVMTGLPPEWEGVRIVHMTDFHIGSRGAPYDLLHRAVATAVDLEPDLIALTGDYFHRGRPGSLDFLAPLACAAPTFAILGNHDYLQRAIGAELIVRELQRQRITVLRNELTAFVHDGVAGIVVGFDDDVRGPGADVAGIVRRMGGQSPSLVLVHEPDAIDRFPDRWASLTLAGHTHGAQVRLSPVREVDWTNLPITEMQSQYPRGWFRVRGNRLYVNRGLGVSRWPIRFAARPEIACFTLTAGGDRCAAHP
jgi:predicted MPP superfamily phosphohydrolase